MDLDLLRSAVDWRDGRLEIVDQTLLPGRLVVLAPATAAEVVDALRRLAVRGAPAIGGGGAFGVVLGLGGGGPGAPPPGCHPGGGGPRGGARGGGARRRRRAAPPRPGRGRADPGGGP